MGPSSPSGSSYFNTIFRGHLYYRRSAKEYGTKENYQYFYPPSSGSSNASSRPSTSKLRLVKVGTVSNSAGLDGQREESNHSSATPVPSIPAKTLKGGSRIQFKDDRPSVSPPMIKRGRFKGHYDDRESRCVFHNLSATSYNHQKCYCTHMPFVESPLKSQFNNPSNQLEIDEDATTTIEVDIESYTPKLKDAHIIARVCQKLVVGIDECGPLEVGIPSTRRSVRKMHSLNNFRKLGMHFRIPEVDDEEGEMEAPTTRHCFTESDSHNQPIVAV